MATIDTIGALIDDGYKVSVHCGNYLCRHSVDLDLHALAERLGRDFIAIGDPNPLVARLRCACCKGKDVGLIIVPRNGYTNGPAPAPAATDRPSQDRRAVKPRRARRRVRL